MKTKRQMYTRIFKALASAAKRYKISPKVERKIRKDLEKDFFLQDSGWNLRENFAVNFRTAKPDNFEADCATSLYLQIGPRDWEWNTEDGDLIGCGTML